MLRYYLLIKYGLSLVPVPPTMAINTKSDIPVIKNIFFFYPLLIATLYIHAYMSFIYTR